MSDYTLYLGDCLEYMRTMEPGSVDAIITDLPYGTTACSWDEIIPFVPMWEGIKQILKPRGAFVTTASQPFTSKLIMSNLDWFKYEWIWRKNQPNGIMRSEYQPMKNHENICVFSKNGHNYYPQKTRSLISDRKTGISNGRESGAYSSDHYGGLKFRNKNNHGNILLETVKPRSVLEFDVQPHSTGTDHPTQKPVALYSYLIQTYTNPDAIVFDMCMGSGTTGVAALQLGRRFIGCEIDPGYFAIAEKRIKQAAAQMLLPLGAI